MNNYLKNYLKIVLLVFACGLLFECTNNPYRPGETAEDTYYTSFSTELSKLDPATSYYSHESQIIDQIYDPLFDYHYLKRPYELIPLSAESLPTPVYFDKAGKLINEKDPLPETVARAEYTIKLRKGVMYQNHPCFAKNEKGEPFYQDLELRDIAAYNYPMEFKEQGTREMIAQDFSLQIRRMADPRLTCPIFSTLARYIDGYSELNQEYDRVLEAERKRRKEEKGSNYNQEGDERFNPIKLDYFSVDFPGIEIIDKHTFKIILKRKYPQIRYWMAMHFFAPVPQEALDLYNQRGMIEKQWSINNCPVGTGAYFLKVFKRTEIMVLEQNPNYREDFYPEEGSPGDKEKGLLTDAGKKVPFIQRQVWKLEKESIPRWNKFIQGYYDASAIASDVFDQAIQMDFGEDPSLSDAMKEKNIKLLTSIDTAFYHIQFNMLDDVVGGYTEDKQKLRQAICIALEYNEYMDLYMNGRGIAAQTPIPPGIFGYVGGAEGTNPFLSEWDPVRERHVRKPIETAKKLLAEAGYPNGIGKDGKPLEINLDHSNSGNPTFMSTFFWMRDRLNLIGVRLKERGTDLETKRKKILKGNFQIDSTGWLADYPDAENFLFLFYGPNGKVKYEGANGMNYENKKYDKVFEQLESMEDGPERMELIKKALLILQKDSPSVLMYFPLNYSLEHDWYKNVKPHSMSNNTLKYKRIDSKQRVENQKKWNQPVYWPVGLLVAIFMVGCLPAAIIINRSEKSHDYR